MTDKTRYGNQTPTFERIGKYHHSDAAACISLFESYGMIFAPWQKYQLELILAKNEDNTVAAQSVCFSVPRQNGKSHGARYAVVWYSMVCGLKCLFSAQNGDVCREFYEFMLNLFENPKQYPDFANEVVNIVKQSGREKFCFKSGGSLMFQTRTNDKQRGISKNDVLVADEAECLTPSMYAAIKYTLSSAKGGDPQTIWCGTPPDPSASRGEQWVQFHKDAHNPQTPTTAWWVEWALTDEDVIDKDTPPERKFELAWKYNPSMGYFVNINAVWNEAHESAWDIYARERLGWWGRAAIAEMIFAKDEWEKLTVKNAPDVNAKNTIVSYGVKFSPDDREVALVAAIRTIDDKKRKHIYVELREVRSLESGTDWLVDWLVARKDKTASVLIDGKNGADDLYNALRDGGFNVAAVSVATTQDAISSTATFKNLARSGRLTHPVSKVLDDSATNSVKRVIGNAGGYGYADGNGDSTPLSAAALAAYSAYTTKRNPKRKAKLLYH